ncbi:hypothetical protein M9H77_30147 [Catharanthus roseus]|uniref:Uncharacterized protein n=1 Tax=Catharanthus roseus TaxID=4058 RepID=A0ACB9ZWF6_CATRO|nr:hypothetical protein M9H77_30147 [Catharanthus roseus]
MVTGGSLSLPIYHPTGRGRRIGKEQMGDKSLLWAVNSPYHHQYSYMDDGYGHWYPYEQEARALNHNFLEYLLMLGDAICDHSCDKSLYDSRMNDYYSYVANVNSFVLGDENKEERMLGVFGNKGKSFSIYKKKQQ